MITPSSATREQAGARVRDKIVEMKKGILGIIGVIVVLILFGAMMPLLTETIDGAEATGTVATLLDNLPLFMVLGVVIAIIAYALAYLHGGGE